MNYLGSSKENLSSASRGLTLRISLMKSPLVVEKSHHLPKITSKAVKETSKSEREGE